MSDWGKANNSPLNLMDQVTSESHQPDKILLHDTTLRDGEQFPGVEFTKGDKVRIGQALSDYGVHRIEIMPAVSSEDFEAASELNALGLPAEIVGFCRSNQGDVMKAVDAGCRSIVMEIVTSPALLKGLGWSFEEATGKFITASQFAKSKGLRVTAFFVAATDAPLEFSKRFIETVLDGAEVDGVCIPDTFSKCMPHAIYHYVRMIKDWTDKPVEIHPHNSFGMGVANAVAGVMAGAEVVHTCMNGLGEGTGNASLDAVAASLEMMLDIDTGIRFNQTYELSKLVEELARVPLQANWPLTGERVFTMESGIAVDLITKMVEAGGGVPPNMDLATVLGRERRIVVGKLSGSTSIRVKMKQLGLVAPDNDGVAEILAAVKQKSIEKHDSLTDDEFTELLAGLGR